MHATEIERSPGCPSLSVTTRRRFTPQGTSFAFLHAVTQPLHSMQRSASQRNFIRAMSEASLSLSTRFLHPLDLAERGLGFLHHRHAVVAVRGAGVDGFGAHERRRAAGIVGQ